MVLAMVRILTERSTTLAENDTTGAVAAVTGNLPLGRMAEFEEIAEAILFHSSE